ncbi:MAG: hypothetical protein CBE49_003245 [Rickettsiales bacterium TMED289]|nr:MAG: hypothetical protein CBE49_003245 [Rickettsiales bacterium TMED289]
MNIIHRGLVSIGSKENSLKSFKLSFKKNYGVETDIHFTKDNKIICYHDYTLNRLFNINKSIKNLTFDNIKKITKSEISVPLLNELLTLSKKKNMVLVEIKPLLSNKAINILINETKKFKNCILISFKHKNLFRIRKINKKIKIGLSFSKKSKVSEIIKISSNKVFDYLILDKFFIGKKSIENLKKIKFFYTIKKKSEFVKYNRKYNLIIEKL